MQKIEPTEIKYTRKLVWLCLSGREEAKIYSPVKFCLARGADPNVKYKKRSVFSYLIHIGYCRISALFIRYGADVNAKEKRYGLYTTNIVPVIHLTIPGFQYEMLTELLSAGAKIEATDNRGRTAVYKAVKLMLEVNTNDSQISGDGMRYIDILVNHGADIFRIDPTSGISAYDLAKNEGKEIYFKNMINPTKNHKQNINDNFKYCLGMEM